MSALDQKRSVVPMRFSLYPQKRTLVERVVCFVPKADMIASSGLEIARQVNYPVRNLEHEFPERCSHGFVGLAMLCAVLTSAIWERACGKLPTTR